MPTDVLCSTVEDLLHHHTSSHIANLHQARPHHPASDSALLDVKKNAAAKQQQCSQTSETTASSSNATDNSGLLKNARSASLPLKILLNDCIGDNNSCVATNTRRTNGGRFTVSDLSQKLIRSWNGMDTFLMNKFNKSPSSSTSSSSAHHHHDAAANGTNFILYARFSLSEHFLNVIEGGDRVPLSPLDRRHREERGDVSSTSSTSSSRSSSNESTSSNSNARNTNSNNNNSNQNTTTENFYLDDMDEEDDVDLDIEEDIDYEDDNEEDDEIEEESSGKTGSVDSSTTASSDAVVQFDLETEDDLQPSNARIELPPAVLSCLGQQQQPECLSDINNNDRNMKDNDEAVVEEDEAKEYDDVDEFDDDDKKQSVVSENEQSTDEAATSNNDLDQTITYEETPVTSKEDQQLNNVVESLKNLDLEELEKDNKAVEVGEKTEYNATSSPVISSQIENDQHRSVSPINVVADDSSNHATNFNADETLNLEDDSEVVSVDTSSGYTSNNNSMTQSSSSSSCSPGETPNTSSILSSETSSPSEPLSPSQSTATMTQSTEDMNKTPTTTTAAPKVVVEDSGSNRQQVNTSSASLSWSIGSSTSSMSSSAEDDAEENIFKNFMPKKSCLKKNYPNRHQLYIDTSNGGSGVFNSDNATSSPLVPATPTSPLSSSISSSPFFSSSSSSFQSPPSSSSHQSEMIRSKKRVSFADVCGKDLYTIRTMSEPSNCPPKLTSKIVQFFLNREFSNQQQNGNGNGFKSPYGASSKNSGVYGDGGDFFSRTRNYGYGISTSNYSNDLNQLAGTIAVYSLNFAQPSADYFKFRQRIVDSSVSLENVMLNRFQINGTIKVKNINFHKYVFIRCSFDKWSTHQDFAAQYVPSEYYSSMMSHNSHHHQQHFNQMLSSLSSSPSFSSSSSSASAYNSTPHHKEFDTFRFEFELPKNPSPSSPQSSTASNSRSGSTPNASIQFCICYRAGDSGEFWDNNEGKNYEILQYVIDIESLKPQSAQRTITSSSSSPSLSDTKSRGASIYSNPSRPINDPITSDIYY